MLLFKFSCIFLLLSFVSANAMFDDISCVKSNFKIEVKHPVMPFGMMETVLKLSKNKCTLSIEHKKYFFFKNKWIIDVCRGPVHAKKDSFWGSVKVLKRVNNCIGKNKKSDFCSDLKKLQSILQDDGLIFAKGEKELLRTDHGRTFCSYLLVESYLGKGRIFNRHDSNIEALSNPDNNKEEFQPSFAPGPKNNDFVQKTPKKITK